MCYSNLDQAVKRDMPSVLGLCGVSLSRCSFGVEVQQGLVRAPVTGRNLPPTTTDEKNKKQTKRENIPYLGELDTVLGITKSRITMAAGRSMRSGSPYPSSIGQSEGNALARVRTMASRDLSAITLISQDWV